MYHWNVSRLADDVVEKRITQEAQASYLATLMMAMWILFMVLGSRDSSAFAYFLGIIIIGGGVHLCWQNNRKGDDQDFIPRFICLGCGLVVPVLVCAALPARILAYIVEDQWGYSLTMYLIPIVLCIYFWRLHHWIGVVARGEVNRGIIAPEKETDNVSEGIDTSH